MVAAVSAGKSSAVVGVYFTLGNSPTVDTALPVDIAILPHQDFSSLRARFDSPGDGLALISGDSLDPVDNAEAETPLAHKLVLMPTEGRRLHGHGESGDRWAAKARYRASSPFP